MESFGLKAFAVAGMLLALLIRASPVQACGGGYGADLEISDAQIVALSYRDGVETYVFQPAFCGGSASFGIILPIPGALEGEPTIADGDLFEALDELSAPKREVEEVCKAEGNRTAGGSPDGGASNEDGFGSGAEVLAGGRVDIFEWVLLEAQSASELTAWLDDNDFPYDVFATDTFALYVDDGFTFVAFKVAEHALEGEACGTFGPIKVRFATDEPIVPLRIATAHEDATWRLFQWRILAVSDAQLETVPGGITGQANLRFSGAIDEDAIQKWPALAELAEPDERLTVLDLEFEGPSVTRDLRLRETATEDFRRTERVTMFVECEEDGCAVVASPRAGLESWCAIAAALLFVARRRRHHS